MSSERPSTEGSTAAHSASSLRTESAQAQGARDQGGLRSLCHLQAAVCIAPRQPEQAVNFQSVALARDDASSQLGCELSSHWSIAGWRCHATSDYFGSMLNYSLKILRDSRCRCEQLLLDGRFFQCPFRANPTPCKAPETGWASKTSRIARPDDPKTSESDNSKTADMKQLHARLRT